MTIIVEKTDYMQFELTIPNRYLIEVSGNNVIIIRNPDNSIYDSIEFGAGFRSVRVDPS